MARRLNPWRPPVEPGRRGLDTVHLLDLGIGGTVRHFAREHGCRVAGIDLAEV